jgi:hypothetical protein
MEKRGGALIDIDRAALASRMGAYFNPTFDWNAYRVVSSALTVPYAGFNPEKTRKKALEEKETFADDRIVRYALRPFDSRWCYYTRASSVWNRSRPTLWAQAFKGNAFLLTRFRSTAVPEGLPVSYSRLLSDDHYMTPDAVAVPFVLPATSGKKAKGKKKNSDQLSAFELEPAPVSAAAVPNISAKAQQWASSIGLEDHKSLWFHVLAISCSSAYLSENADGVAANWPRIPLPNSEELLEASAKLGEELAALLDTENPVGGVTAGILLPELKLIGALHKVDGKPLDEAEDLKITAGWGHAGKGGVTMPGQGKLVERERTENEMSNLVDGASAFNSEDVIKLLGATTCDVYLNNDCVWKNIPVKVWELFIGGYQVIKKWLSYRHFSFINRPLTPKEADEVTAMARRLTALCLMQPKLDANYFSIKAAAYSWPQPSSEAELAVVAVDLES